MRVLSAIMALMVGFTPVSFAKDETGESPSNRGERGNSSRVEAERGELGSLKTHLLDPPIPKSRPMTHPMDLG